MQKSWKESNTLSNLKEGHYEVLDTGLDRPLSEWSFSLDQTGRKHIKCSSYEDLKDQIKYYGLPERLAIFDKKRYSKEDDCIENHYQNWSATAYPPTKYGDWVD